MSRRPRSAGAASPASVLLFTHSGDVYVPDVVAHALEKRGAKARRIDTDTHLSIAIENGSAWLDDIDLARVHSAWIRRLWTRAPDVDLAEHARRQSHDALLGVIESLRHVVNPLSAQVRAERKVLQLEAAKRAGLDVPRTLISNDPRAVRNFARTPIITKLLVPLSQTMDGSGLFMHTSAVDDEDLAHIDSVRHAPQIFQERIEKRLEVRVVVVGKTIFAASTEASTLDWRLGQGTWRKIAVKHASAIRKLMTELGLTMGALDFVVDKENTWWFLEINPAGEWGWLEQDLGFPISTAIARELLA